MFFFSKKKIIKGSEILRNEAKCKLLSSSFTRLDYLGNVINIEN